MSKEFQFNPKQQQQKQPPQAQVNIDPRDLDDVVCEKCGNYTFELVILMKRVPAVLSPEGKESFLPMNIFACHACGHINTRFLAGVQWFSDEKLKDMGAGPVDPDKIEGSDLIVEE